MSRPDLLWSVNTLARMVTKWNQACDKRLHRLIAYLYWTKDWVQTCFVGDHPEACSLALFCDASFGGDLQDSKSTTGGFLYLTGPNTFVPITWLCKKHGAVSHSSTEAEVISLDACVRMEGLPAMTFWDTVIQVMHPEKYKPQIKGETIAAREGSHDSPQTKGGKFLPGYRPPNRILPTVQNILDSVDFVPPMYSPPTGISKMVVLEDNDATIKMVIKGRSPAMRHVQRAHRIDLD